jgi:ABC-type Fe3+ transport system substrate-binding protein
MSCRAVALRAPLFAISLAWLLSCAAPGARPEQPPLAGQPPAPSAPDAQAGWEPAWNALVEAARREGKVVVKGPPTAAVRTELPRAFRERFGVDPEYLGGPSSDVVTQLQLERQGGVYSTDVILAGADSMYTSIQPQGMLDPLRPVLIHPAALDTTGWPDGRLWFADPEQQYILRLNNSLTQMLYANTAQVQPETIRSWYDLLRPEYQGRIASFDPTVSGAGISTASYLRHALGDDFTRRLFVDQKPVLTRDHRELADWLARGIYPIALSLREVEFAQIAQDGFPVAVLPNPPEAPGHVTAGFGLLGLLNGAPHPNAARLLVNWLASPDGMAAWSKAQKIVPVRTDLDASYARDQVPDPNVTNYFDSFEWEFVVHERAQTMDWLRRQLR